MHDNMTVTGVLQLVYKQQCICQCCDAKGGLNGICIWMYICAVLLFLDTLPYWYWAPLLALYLLMFALLHVGAGIFGSQFQSSVTLTNQLKENVSPQLYHRRSIRATLWYTCLSFLYFLALVYLVVYLFIIIILITSYGDGDTFAGAIIWIVLAVVLWLFICYLPFHATQLISTINQQVNQAYQTFRVGAPVQVVTVVQGQTNAVVVGGVPLTTDGK